MKYLLLFLFLSHFQLNGYCQMKGDKDRLPNLIIIFIDDMGYGDIGPFGSKVNSTPNLDRMAFEGLKLTSFYVASPVCTPSRAALMTGSYPQRVGLNRGSGHIVLFPGDRHALNQNEITIAEMLKSKGYATGCFGKWHLGDQPGYLPLDQGFDTYYGIPYSNDMWAPYKRWPFPDLPVINNNEVEYLVKDMNDQADLCKKFTEKAVDFITQNKDQPFFCYLPHSFVHGPRQATELFMKNAETVEEAQVEEVDWSVGQILNKLKELEIDKNTFVIFTSDNGPDKGLSAGPLRGSKGSAYEGGHREPTIAWWPGRIHQGVSDEICTSMDLLPTFARLAGAEAPKDRVIDGKDIWPLLSGKKKKTPHKAFFYQERGELAAVRAGDWKLFVKGELYNLKEDISESNDLSKINPEKVEELQKLLDDFRIEVAENSRPVGVIENSRTLIPRFGVQGEEAFKPTLLIKEPEK